MCDDNENTTTIDELAEMFQNLDDHGIRDVDPKKHSLNLI